jgi:hypothetical protein
MCANFSVSSGGRGCSVQAEHVRLEALHSSESVGSFVNPDGTRLETRLIMKLERLTVDRKDPKHGSQPARNDPRDAY